MANFLDLNLWDWFVKKAILFKNKKVLCYKTYILITSSEKVLKIISQNKITQNERNKKVSKKKVSKNRMHKICFESIKKRSKLQKKFTDF